MHIKYLLGCVLVATKAMSTVRDPEPVTNIRRMVTQIFDALVEDMKSPVLPLPDSAKMSVPDQIADQGLKFESFDVTTEDGYINSLWHVWDESAEPLRKANGDKKTLFLQHGLIDIAGTWFFNENSPAYNLSKQGYDVWLGNNRGTANSYKHVSLNYHKKKYWQFSFNEMGKYDVPAFLETVLNKTGVEKLTYLGHSQGTTQFWIANIFHENLAQRIESFVGFAPVMFVGHCTSDLISLLTFLKIDVLIEAAFKNVLFKASGIFAEIGPVFIDRLPRTVWAFVEAIVGFDQVSHMNPERMPMMGRNDVGGTGTLNLKHWTQNMKSGNFADLNGVEYDTSVLQKNLANTHLQLFVGANDALAQELDFTALLQTLLLTDIDLVKIADYNHLDYMWADDADEYVNQHLYKFLENH